MRQKIHFTGKNLNDVFFLPCVAGILKDGDWLVEEDGGKWHVEEGGEE